MRDELLKIADYIEALEQRLAAAEKQLAEDASHFVELESQVAALNARVAELEARPVPEAAIEMDWVDEEPEDVEEQETTEEPEAVEEPEAAEEPKSPAAPEQLEISEAPEEPEIKEEVPQPVETPKPAETPKPLETPKPASPAQAPVADLRLAISLGDRFLFQRELFGQNGELMQKTIEILNNQPNLDAAMAYLDKHFDWDKESSTYELFLNALRRRLN